MLTGNAHGLILALHYESQIDLKKTDPERARIPIGQGKEILFIR